MFTQPFILKIFKFTAKLGEQYGEDSLLSCCHVYQFLLIRKQLRARADSVNLDKDAFLRNQHTTCTPQKMNSSLPASANKQLVIQVHSLPVVPNMSF